MNLAQVRNSMPAWRVLSGLKKPPKLAYRLLKYEKKVEKELGVIEDVRNSLVYKHAGVEPPIPPDQTLVQIGQDTPEYAAYQAEFLEFLEGKCDLEWTGLSMEELLDGLSAEAANCLMENDLDLLEPFFTPPPVSG